MDFNRTTIPATSKAKRVAKIVVFVCFVIRQRVKKVFVLLFDERSGAKRVRKIYVFVLICGGTLASTPHEGCCFFVCTRRVHCLQLIAEELYSLVKLDLHVLRRNV